MNMAENKLFQNTGVIIVMVLVILLYFFTVTDFKFDNTNFSADIYQIMPYHTRHD